MTGLDDLTAQRSLRDLDRANRDAALGVERLAAAQDALARRSRLAGNELTAMAALAERQGRVTERQAALAGAQSIERARQIDVETRARAAANQVSEAELYHGARRLELARSEDGLRASRENAAAQGLAQTAALNAEQAKANVLRRDATASTSQATAANVAYIESVESANQATSALTAEQTKQLELTKDASNGVAKATAQAFTQMLTESEDALAALEEAVAVSFEKIAADAFISPVIKPIIQPVVEYTQGLAASITADPLTWAAPLQYSGTMAGLSGAPMLGNLLSIGSVAASGFATSPTTIGTSLVGSEIGQSLGLSSGLGTAINASPWGAFGSLGANLLGLGWDDPVLGTVASTTGSVGGAFLGTQLGAVGGPIGAIIGSFLATALGEAFSDQDFPYAIGTVSAENGRAQVSYTSELDGGDEAAMAEAAGAIAASLNAIFDVYDVKPVSLSTSIGTNVARGGALTTGIFAGGGGTFNEGATYMGLDDAAEAAGRAVLFGIETADYEDLPEELARVFDIATSFEDLESFTDMVDFSVVWDEMTNAFLNGHQDWEKAVGTVADDAAASLAGTIGAYLDASAALFAETDDAAVEMRQRSNLAAAAAIDRLATGEYQEPEVSEVEAGLSQIGAFYAKLGTDLVDEVQTILDNGAQPDSWNTLLASEAIGGDVGKLTAALMEQGAGTAVDAFVETWSSGLDAALLELTDPLGAKVAELGEWLARSLDDAALIEAAGGDGRAETITATYNAMLTDAVGDLYEPLLGATDQAVIALDGWRLAAVSYADETGHSLAEIERVYGIQRADILRAGLDDQLAATREAAGALVSALETAGRDYRSGLLDFDLQGMAALADVAMSGGDVGLAGATLEAQRAGLEADLLQRRLLDAIDLQIGAVEANTSAAQDIVAVFGDLGRRLIATADAFKIDPSLSPLAPLAQLEEVRRQWDVQADAADAAEARRVAALRGGDDAGMLAASEDLVEALGAMSGLGQSRIEAARGYYATSNFDDYWDVDAALRGWGEEIGELVDPAQASLDVARLQLDTLEDLRDQAARSIAQQVSAITGVSGDIGALQTMLDEALRAVVASQSALANQLGVTGATTSTSFDALAQAVYRAAPVSGQFGADVFSKPGVEANRWVDFARALGYGGEVGGGQINALLASDPAFAARMEQAAQMYTAGRSAGIVGTFGFASGGIMTPRGPLPLEMYAEGGVARSPQLALFGEGRMPEAYVPLPDGRSIPVSLDWTPPANDDGGALIAVLREEVSGLRDEIRALRGVTAQGALDVGDAVRQGNRDLADLRGAAQRAAA